MSRQCLFPFVIARLRSSRGNPLNKKYGSKIEGIVALFILLFTGMGVIYAALVYIIYLLGDRSGNTGEDVEKAENFAAVGK